MKSSRKIAIPLLYLQGLVQGIGFTTIPAAGNLLTTASGFSFTTAEYGRLFIPMIIGAIVSSLLGGVIAKRRGIKAVLLFAGLANVVSMLAFASSKFVMGDATFSYSLLLLCMLFLGSGFGANLAALNPFVIHYFPKKQSAALTALHSCLGIGTAIGPLAFSLFFENGIWWMDPVSIALCYFLLFLLSFFYLPSKINFIELIEGKKEIAKRGLWIFALIAFIYGVTETAFGNWASIFLHLEKGFSQLQANIALSLFWASVTLGRVLIVFLSLIVSPKFIYQFLSVVILIGLGFIHFIAKPDSAMAAFVIAGLGCSAFLPLTISFAEKRFFSSAPFVSGLLISTYMAGFGVSSEGMGFLHREGLSFISLYLWLVLPVLLLAFLCYSVTKSR